LQERTMDCHQPEMLEQGKIQMWCTEVEIFSPVIKELAVI
jgi:hypothetical protein